MYTIVSRISKKGVDLVIHFKLKIDGMWKDLSVDEYQILSEDVKNCVWIDFQSPTKEEIKQVLQTYHFHPASIEECLDDVQRPKVEFFTDYTFIIAHSINKEMEASEINMFITNKVVITVHKIHSEEMAHAWKKLSANETKYSTSHMLAHYILDSIVDNYFDILYILQDKVNNFSETVPNMKDTTNLLAEVFDLRKDLHRLRKSIFPMRDLLYRLCENTNTPEKEKRYYKTVFHHLQHVCESIEELQSITNDVRDNLLSISGYETNQIMKTLTIITTIFMPLTVIVGIYGMNFANMPELRWQYGYFGIMILMFVMVVLMTLWFRKKKWF